ARAIWPPAETAAPAPADAAEPRTTPLSRPPASGSGLPANVVRRSTRAAAGRDPPEHLPVRRPSGRHSPRLAPGHRLGRRDALRRSAFVVDRQPSLLHDPGAHGV